MFHTEILIKGKIGSNWTDWFEEMQIISDACGNTVLRGDLRDISAVYGILSHLSCLGITFISVNCREKIC